MYDFLHHYGIAYKGKEVVLSFVEASLEYDPASEKMVYRNDFSEALRLYAEKTGGHRATAQTVGQHLSAAGVKVRRLGVTGQQKYCYVGLSWKEGLEYETVEPAKRGRKRKVVAEGEPGPKRRVSDTAGHEKDLVQACTGHLAPCTLQWDGAEMRAVLRDTADLQNELKGLLKQRVPGWWNKRNGTTADVEETADTQDSVSSVDFEHVEDDQDGLKLQNLLDDGVECDTQDSVISIDFEHVEDDQDGLKLQNLLDDGVECDTQDSVSSDGESDQEVNDEDGQKMQELIRDDLQLSDSSDGESDQEVVEDHGQELIRDDLQLSDSSDGESDQEVVEEDGKKLLELMMDENGTDAQLSESSDDEESAVSSQALTF